MASAGSRAAIAVLNNLWILSLAHMVMVECMRLFWRMGEWSGSLGVTSSGVDQRPIADFVTNTRRAGLVALPGLVFDPTCMHARTTLSTDTRA